MYTRDPEKKTAGSLLFDGFTVQDVMQFAEFF